MEDNNQVPDINLEIKPEIAVGKYSNLALISHSHSDFVLDFAAVLPGMPKPEVGSRIIMAPEHAKRLAAALQQNLMKYEQEFGKIDLGMLEERIVAPFGNGDTQS